MIDWTRGYECQWRFSTVDLVTWASKTVINGVSSATYSADSSTDAIETSTLSRRGSYTERPIEGWVRIEGTVTQGSDSELVTVGTTLLTAETSSWAGGTRSDSMRGVSVLQPASEADPLADGAWAAKGSDAAARVAALIGGCTPAPIVVHGAPQLPDTVVFDLESKPLAAAKVLLDATKWIARPDGTGRIHIMQIPDKPSAYFGAGERGLFLSTASSDSNKRITYTRSWWPGLRVWDMFTANLPEIGLAGTFRVYSQRVKCDTRILVEETVEEVS